MIANHTSHQEGAESSHHLVTDAHHPPWHLVCKFVMSSKEMDQSLQTFHVQDFLVSIP